MFWWTEFPPNSSTFSIAEHNEQLVYTRSPMNLLRLTWPVVLAAALTLGMARFSQAANSLNIEWSGAYLLKLDAPATDVIIANPLVADVTVQAPDRLVIIGKLPGVTRLIVMN